MNSDFKEELPDYQLDNLEGMANYYRWIMDIFTPYIGRRILEIGAGTGTFSRLLQSHPATELLVLVEPDSRLNNRLKTVFADENRVLVVPLPIEKLTSDMLLTWRIDTIVIVNVMEHLRNDADILALLENALPPGGKILTFSPAFPILYSKFDASVGHCRRYTKKTLTHAFQQARLNILKIMYFNLPGFFTWLIMMRVLRSSHFGKKRVSLFNFAIPFIQNFEKYCSPPVGQSIVAIAEKPHRK